VIGCCKPFFIQGFRVATGKNIVPVSICLMLKEFSVTCSESPLRIDAKKAIGELKAGASQSP
jgi:hypothetical protein|tara:strand:+ start:1217 stop:1402 length:186 start_codon:yes stop_codon:yes gene_type:complete